MRIHLVVAGAVVFALIASLPAQADRASYCQAYARDFSDQRATDKAQWQHKYEIALDACLANGKSASAVAKTVAMEKPVAAAVVGKSRAAVPKAVAVDTVKPAVAAALPKLVDGSTEWNDYCAKKYTSFDAKTGMYLSHTGISRRCVVSPEVKS